MASGGQGPPVHRDTAPGASTYQGYGVSGQAPGQQQPPRLGQPQQGVPVAPAPYGTYAMQPGYYGAQTAVPGAPGMQTAGRTWVNPNDPNTVYYEGFDPGARFTAANPPTIPPPPPGVAPNPAQLAQMQGQNVVVTQRQAGFFEGSPGGGVDTSCVLN